MSRATATRSVRADRTHSAIASHSPGRVNQQQDEGRQAKQPHRVLGQNAQAHRAAQERPDEFRSLRVRMGGWFAYFTMLSREQQDHHIRRQEGRS
jgi:hypothetical protein